MVTLTQAGHTYSSTWPHLLEQVTLNSSRRSHLLDELHFEIAVVQLASLALVDGPLANLGGGGRQLVLG